MTDDIKFTPKLGRIRGKSGKKAKRFLHQVLAATALAGGVGGKKNSRFTGARLGRGASVARIMASRDRLSGYRSRRGLSGLAAKDWQTPMPIFAMSNATAPPAMATRRGSIRATMKKPMAKRFWNAGKVIGTNSGSSFRLKTAINMMISNQSPAP
jgi:hypothetical protein